MRHNDPAAPTGEKHRLALSDEELSLIKNSLNEVVNGLAIDSFVGRLGVDWGTARTLLDDVRSMRADRVSRLGHDPGDVAMSTVALDLVARGIDVALHDIDAAEFQTRLGAEPAAARRLAGRIETLIVRPSSVPTTV